MKHNSLENLKKGTPHQFGVQWPGRRCGAKTRRGTKCRAPAVRSSSRCRMHGATSCGPTSNEGKQRIAAAKFKSGKYTIEQKRARSLRARELKTFFQRASEYSKEKTEKTKIDFLFIYAVGSGFKIKGKCDKRCLAFLNHSELFIQPFSKFGKNTLRTILLRD